MIETVKVIIPILGDYNYWLPLAQRAFESVDGQLLPDQCDISIEYAGTLQAARNSALESKSDWLVFLDADDQLAPNYLPYMLLGDGDVRVPFVVRRYPDGSENLDQTPYLEKDLIKGNYVVVGAMIKTDLFKKVGGFRNWELYEDWDLFLRLQESGAVFKPCHNARYIINVRPQSRNEPPEETKLLIGDQIRDEAKARRGL